MILRTNISHSTTIVFFFSFCSKNVFHILNLFVCADENLDLNNMKISLDVQPEYLKQLSLVM